MGLSIGVLAFGVYYGLSFLPGESYSAGKGPPGLATTTVSGEKVPLANISTSSQKLPLPQVTYIPTPQPTKAIYMTSCVAGTPSWRGALVKLIERKELNAVVIDIKDYSGTITFPPTNPLLKENGGTGCRAADLPQFIYELHQKNIYVIGRITVFQDPYYTKTHPELAVKKLSDGSVWKDYKGLSFIDVGAKPYWDYIVALSKESYGLGFDELNFDYVRFPSDGNMKDIDYAYSRGKTKAEALREFFEYLHGQLKDIPSTSSGQAPSNSSGQVGAVLSVDLFGMSSTNTDDLNIGQILENALPYFDYIDPMVYPSHYPPHFNGWADPNKHPYEVVNFSLKEAVKRATATTTPVRLFDSVLVSAATGTTPTLWSKPVYPASKIRPWLQDFQYGGYYGPKEVRAQIQATYDAGLDSWLLWDPGNKYTPSALLDK